MKIEALHEGIVLENVYRSTMFIRKLADAVADELNSLTSKNFAKSRLADIITDERGDLVLSVGIPRKKITGIEFSEEYELFLEFFDENIRFYITWDRGSHVASRYDREEKMITINLNQETTTLKNMDKDKIINTRKFHDSLTQSIRLAYQDWVSGGMYIPNKASRLDARFTQLATKLQFMVKAEKDIEPFIKEILKYMSVKGRDKKKYRKKAMSFAKHKLGLLPDEKKKRVPDHGPIGFIRRMTAGDFK